MSMSAIEAAAEVTATEVATTHMTAAEMSATTEMSAAATTTAGQRIGRENRGSQGERCEYNRNLVQREIFHGIHLFFVKRRSMRSARSSRPQRSSTVDFLCVNGRDV